MAVINEQPWDDVTIDKRRDIDMETNCIRLAGVYGLTRQIRTIG
jgi:hypothetical protein